MCAFVPVMMAMMAVSGGLQIAGQQAAARAQQSAANFNASVARNNATIAEQNVRKVQLEGARQEESQRIKTANMIGAQQAAFGASGADVSSGSALDVQGATAALGQSDLLTIRTGTNAREAGLHQQATDFTNQASLLVAQGKNARTAANYESAATLLKTGTSMASLGQSQGLWGQTKTPA